MIRNLILLSTLAIPALALPASAQDPCANIPHADHPTAVIHNRTLSAVLFLPDAQHGFYRGPRFDWSGLIPCASLNGHTFFSEWFPRYDPTISDAVVGPAEEFRHPTSELGYDEAAPGGLFLKIGVGILRRIDDTPYRFGVSYPIVDTGRWTVRRHKRSITYRQELHSTIGYAYLYEKTLSIDRHTNVLTITHRLHNLGAKPLDTAVYNHDFFILDHQPIGPGMELRLPFTPVPDKPLPASAEIVTQPSGATIRILSPLQPRAGLGAYITGFSNRVSDFDFTFQDTVHGIGIEETSDSPLAKMYLWATPKTFCPEGYVAIDIPPGQTQSWTLHYRFFTPDKS